MPEPSAHAYWVPDRFTPRSCTTLPLESTSRFPLTLIDKVAGDELLVVVGAGLDDAGAVDEATALDWDAGAVEDTAGLELVAGLVELAGLVLDAGVGAEAGLELVVQCLRAEHAPLVVVELDLRVAPFAAETEPINAASTTAISIQLRDQRGETDRTCFPLILGAPMGSETPRSSIGSRSGK